MAAGDNMNLGPLNTTLDYPATQTAPGSSFSTLVMLLQILLHNKKLHQQREQELQMTPNITWPQNNFTTGGQPNSKVYTTTYMKNNDVNKVVEKRQISEPLETDEREGQAGKSNKDTLEQVARLYTEIAERYATITSLRKELDTCRNATNQDRQSEIDSLHAEIKKQETDRTKLIERIASLEITIQEYQKQITNLQFKNEQQGKEIKDLRKELEEMKMKGEDVCHSIRDLQPLSVPDKVGKSHNVMLKDHFAPGSKVVIRGKAGVNVYSMNFDLGFLDTILFHMSNRWNYPNRGHRLVLNTYDNHQWGKEVVTYPEPINEGAEFVVTILCLEKQMKVCINDKFVTEYTHRLPPKLIDHLSIMNAQEITSIYYRGYN